MLPLQVRVQSDRSTIGWVRDRNLSRYKGGQKPKKEENKKKVYIHSVHSGDEAMREHLTSCMLLSLALLGGGAGSSRQAGSGGQRVS